MAIKHPELSKILKDEIERLRQRENEIRNLPLPQVPPELEQRRGFYGASLEERWAEAWKKDCGVLANTFGDAAYRLEEHAKFDDSALNEIIEWRLNKVGIDPR